MFFFFVSVMSGNSADSFSDDSDMEMEKGKDRVEVGKKGGQAGAKKKGGSPHPSAVVSPTGHKRRGSQPKSGEESDHELLI